MAHPPFRLVMAHRQLERLSLRSRADRDQPVSICHDHKKQQWRLRTLVPICLLMSTSNPSVAYRPATWYLRLWQGPATTLTSQHNSPAPTLHVLTRMSSLCRTLINL